MSVYTDLMNAVNHGKRFKVDLANKSLWIDKKQIIEKGVVLNNAKTLIEPNDFVLLGCDELLNINPWQWIERLYTMYRYSVPSEDDNYCRSYFCALPVEQLTDTELAYNCKRIVGQSALEGYILLATLQGWLRWEFGEHWFWQSAENKDLVVLRNWIER